MLLNFIVREGVVYVPTVAKTQAGFYKTIEPVAIVELSDTQTLKSALKRMLLKGNPVIPTPKAGAQSKPVVLKYSPVKSWSKFEKEATYWTVSKENGIYEFGPLRRRDDRGWEEDPKRIRKMSPDCTVDEVVDYVVTSVQSSSNRSNSASSRKLPLED